MPVARDDLLDHLRTFLRTEAFTDYTPIGLQVAGKDDVAHVVTGVSANQPFFEAAAAAGADFLLVHHGMFWQNEGPVVVAGALKRRLAYLLQHDLTLAAYHLPLDAHDEVGNNATALRALGATDLAPWGDSGGQVIGWRGRFEPARPAPDVVAAVAALYGSKPTAFLGGPDAVGTIGIVSGGAQGMFRQALADGLDCFVTGEVSEWVQAAALEGGAHFIGAGHHATERIGIKALGDHVAKTFNVKHTFVDIPNPV